MFRCQQSHTPLRCATWRADTLLISVLACLMVVVMMLSGCSSPFNTADDTNGADEDSSTVQTFTPTDGDASATLRIASGSENKEVAAAIQQAVDDSGVAVKMHYMGSLDIMQTLEQGGGDYDAVWPASSIWISMGDTKHIVKEQSSTSATPIVFGIAKTKANELGWANADGSTKPVSTQELIEAVQAGKLSFSMTSATQSNSGASAYLAFLTALSGKEEALSADDLKNESLRQSAKELLSGVDRSSGSSDWLKDMVVADSDRFDSMVNYESLVIAANRELEAKGADPLLAVYPADGIAISDSPLGYVDRGQGLDDDYGRFSQALQSKESKLLFEQAGRRTGLGGTLAYASDSKVKEAFRADWGITTSTDALKAIPMPAADVIEEALEVYQTELRKPSWTVWVVDYSGSMSGEGKDGVVRGLNEALDPTKAAASRIQPSEEDVNILIPFSSVAMRSVRADGSNTAELLDYAAQLDPDGGTNIYVALNTALDSLPDDPSTYTTAIVLMTDGMSMDQDRDDFEREYRSNSQRPPIFSIMFGDAQQEQLDDIATLSNAKVFDGRTGDLAQVFRQVKGYN